MTYGIFIFNVNSFYNMKLPNEGSSETSLELRNLVFNNVRSVAWIPTMRSGIESTEGIH